MEGKIMEEKSKSASELQEELLKEGFVFGLEEDEEVEDFASDEDINAALAQLATDGGAISNPPHYDDEDDDEERIEYLASEGIVGCDDCALGLCDCGYDFGE